MKLLTEIPNVPRAIGPYSVGAECENFVYLSGQIAIDPETNTFIGGDVKEQAVQVMKNIRAILEHLSLPVTSIAKCTLFLKDLGDFQTVNEIYASYLDGHRPARSTIQVAALPCGAAVEVEAIIWKGK